MNRIIARYEDQVYHPGELTADSENTAKARAALTADPGNVSLLNDLAAALKAQLRYYEAAECYSEILKQNPFNREILCRRGHMYIGLRKYQEASVDLEMGLRLDPYDWDCLYHNGLCYYLLGDYETAEEYYRRCYAASCSEEDLTAVSDWLWLTLMHLDREEEAAAVVDAIGTDGWDYGENAAYYARLLVYKGVKDAGETLRAAREMSSFDFCTYAYGIAYYLYKVKGEKAKAEALLAELSGLTESQWGGFALQAAQAAMKRGL